MGRSAALWLCLALTASMPAAAEDFEQPQAHFRVDNPAELDGPKAEAIYRRIRSTSLGFYRMSGDPSSEDYPTWQRYNRVPYRSATHGNRFVNNYGNRKAKGYGGGPAGTPLPEGAVLAKDSFTVTADGEVFTGPLFLMEKMAPGFDAETRDWRYSMIMPDGSLFGRTGGPDAARVGFCATCHRTAGELNDELFFVPERYRHGADAQ